MFIEKKNLKPVAMWFLPLVFFCYQFILRLWPGLMMHPIMQQFSIDASHFGVMAAFYYFGYAGMQIPIACLMEKWQTKWVIFIFALLCGTSTLLFTYTNHFYVACACRFLIGAGSAVGFLGVSKVVSEWFSEANYSKLIAYSFSIGLLGAIYGGKPISLLLDKSPWQQVALVLAVVAIIIACLNLVLLHSPAGNQSHNEAPVFKWSYLLTLLSSPKIILLAIANLFMVGALEGFSDVWGVPYLMTAYTIDKATAAELISFVFFGMLFGGPLLARLSKLFSKYVVIAGSGLAITVLFSILLCAQHYNWIFLACLFFSVGVFCCYQVIVFAAGASMVKPHYLGVTIAFLNCVNMLGGSFFHTIIGEMMDFNSIGTDQYSLATYQHALMFIPIFSCLGAVIVIFLKLQQDSRLTLVRNSEFKGETSGIST